MAQVKFHVGNKSSLPVIATNGGEIFCCSDVGEMYISKDNLSLQLYTNIILLEDEDEKDGLFAPLTDKFYYIKSTKKFYNFDGNLFNLIGTGVADNITIIGGNMIKYSFSESFVVANWLGFSPNFYINLSQSVHKQGATNKLEIDFFENGESVFCDYKVDDFGNISFYSSVPFDGYLIVTNPNGLKLDEQSLTINDTVQNLELTGFNSAIEGQIPQKNAEGKISWIDTKFCEWNDL